MLPMMRPSRSYLPVAALFAISLAFAASISSTGVAGFVSLYADAYVVQEGGQLFSVIDLYADLPSLE